MFYCWNWLVTGMEGVRARKGIRVGASNVDLVSIHDKSCLVKRGW